MNESFGGLVSAILKLPFLFKQILLHFHIGTESDSQGTLPSTSCELQGIVQDGHTILHVGREGLHDFVDLAAGAPPS